jgi:hypothetical protein
VTHRDFVEPAENAFVLGHGALADASLSLDTPTRAP